MICDKCGTKIEEGSDFCWACGNKIENSNVVNNEDLEDNLLDKYRNNINFFRLSDDKDTQEDNDSFISPNFSQDLNDSQLNQNENNLIDAPIFPNTFFEQTNSGQTNFEQTNFENIDNPNVLPDNIFYQNETNLVQNDNQSLFPNNEPSSLENEQIETVQILDNMDSNITPNIDTNQTGNINESIVDSPVYQNDNNLNIEVIQEQSINPNENIDNKVDNNKLNENDEQKTTDKEKKKTNNNLIVFIAIAFIAIIIVIVFLTNRDSKQITCVQKGTDNGVSIETSIESSFKNNRIEKLSISGSYTVDNAYIAYIDKFYETVKEELKKYDDVKNTDVITNNENNIITYTVTSSDAKSLFKASLNNNGNTAEDFMNAAEEQGYKCNVIEN